MERWEQVLGDLVAERGAALKRHAFLLCGDDGLADDLPQAVALAAGRAAAAARRGRA